MWKALINLVNRLFYKCEHNYESIREAQVLDREMYEKGIEIYSGVKFTYFCCKCGDSKIIDNS